MPRLYVLLVAEFLPFAVPGLHAVATAQANNGKGPAFTEPPAGDPNYPLIGEFIGPISTGAESDGEEGEGNAQEPEMLGLQIRSIGGNEFEALSFMGGLPGQDKHQAEAVRMIGRRSSDFVVLSGGPWAIFVEKDSCLILDRKGNKVGQLERIHRVSPTLGAQPPQDAIVLFDGTNIDHFTNAQMTSDGLLMEGADLKPMFQDFNLHVEFRLPYMPEADGQARGNSGLYLQSRYECQVLDSFAVDAVFNGCGALYKFRKPDLNMCLPPLVWQSYDVQFTAPRWASDGSKIRDAHITSWLNGVKVHDNVALPNKTGAGKPEEPVLLPIRLQDHGDPVRFRNVWIVDRGLAVGDFPVYPTKEELEAAAKAEAEKIRKAEEAKKAAAKKKREAAKKKQAEAEMKQAEAAAEKKKAEAEKKPAEPNKKQAKEAEQKEAAKPAAEKESKAKQADPKEDTNDGKAEAEAAQLKDGLKLEGPAKTEKHAVSSEADTTESKEEE